MEFRRGTFQSAWERRRADLLDELASGRKPVEALDWDWQRRGSVTRLSVEGRERIGVQRSELVAGPARSGFVGDTRPMRARFQALARGSQPAVIKVSSHGSGAQAAGRLNYISRDGVVELESETGERLTGKPALTALRADWKDLFSHRAASRDIAVFGLSIEAPQANQGIGTDEVHLIAKRGLGERRFVYGVRHEPPGRLEIEGLVVLRDPSGNRLSGDAPAARAVQALLDLDPMARARNATFSFRRFGSGVDYAAARMRSLIERFDGHVVDESGRRIASPDEASGLVRKTWRAELHTRRPRDFMHLILSARAGTDIPNFTNAVRDFLGEQFAGHRYVFAIHDPAKDPKPAADGGKRAHVHAHAIVTMRSEDGRSLKPYIADFRVWRMALAEKARQNGIAMEATDRRDRASPPAFTRNQVRPVSYDGTTSYVGTSLAGQSRYDAKRSDVAVIDRSAAAGLHAREAGAVWREIAASATDPSVARHARDQAERIADALHQNTRAATARLEERNVHGDEATRSGEQNAMRQMTRPQFEAYEKHVEAVLRDTSKSLDPKERKHFDGIAAAARDIVRIRRDELRLREDIEAQQRRQTAEQRAVTGHAAVQIAPPARSDPAVVPLEGPAAVDGPENARRTPTDREDRER